MGIIRFGFSHLLQLIMIWEPGCPKISDMRVLISDFPLPSQADLFSKCDPRCSGHVLFCCEHMEPSPGDTLVLEWQSLIWKQSVLFALVRDL